MNVPPLLIPGDTIALISPSRVIRKEQMHDASRVFKKWELTVLEASTLFAEDGYFAGTDDQRLAEWQWAINNPQVKAIFCARGGYGLTRYVDRIDFSPLITSPKWIIGFSDVTAAHLALSNAGIPSIHGLMPVQYGYDGIASSLKSLKELLFKGVVSYQIPNTALISGSTVAPVVGGNLSLLVESLGTDSEIQTDNKILLIEEIDEYLYKVDRMLNQLFRAGKFDKLKGLIIGDFSDLKDTQIPFGKSFIEICQRYISGRYPAAFNVPIGHENHNLALPMGVPVELEIGDSDSNINVRIHPHQA